MAYTFQTKPTPTYATTGELDNFNNFVTAGAHTSIGAANGIQTTDASATPVPSPIALNTTVKLINIPPNAQYIYLLGSAAWTFSELLSNTSYASVAAGQLITLPTGRMTAVYVTAATTATLNFWFAII